ncbi:SUMF1/EgtB/PvdO family nonheme iron enzyme [Botrimarina sp.]|uniref:formylglycine-generating enzyme family protein n=1 Tax=Botrimarina sp. TaxID=2795802 RepID=UPI0032EFCE71
MNQFPWACIASSIAALLLAAPHAVADTFGSGSSAFELVFVDIGAPGNPADAPQRLGSVSRAFQISKYEISESQIAKAAALGAFSGRAIDDVLAVQRGPDRPASGISWFDAARFANWLNHQVGAQPAYNFDSLGRFQNWTPDDPGFDVNNLFRNSLAVYALPTTDEWYKAAFYDPVSRSYSTYATQSDDPPTPVTQGVDFGTAVYQQEGPAPVHLAGGQSYFGAVGQSGNVLEWHETEFDFVNDTRTGARNVLGGDWRVAGTAIGLSSSLGTGGVPDIQPLSTGFRVAKVPEPSCLAPALFAAACSMSRRRRARHCPACPAV